MICQLCLLAITFFFKEGFIENRQLWLVLKKLFNYRSKNRYRALERIVKNDPKWPPINETIYSDQVKSQTCENSHVYENPVFDDVTEIQETCKSNGDLTV